MVLTKDDAVRIEVKDHPSLVKGLLDRIAGLQKALGRGPIGQAKKAPRKATRRKAQQKEQKEQKEQQEAVTPAPLNPGNVLQKRYFPYTVTPDKKIRCMERYIHEHAWTPLVEGLQVQDQVLLSTQMEVIALRVAGNKRGVRFVHTRSKDGQFLLTFKGRRVKLEDL